MRVSESPDRTVSLPRVRTLQALPFSWALCLALLANFMVFSGHDLQRVLELSVLLGGGITVLTMHRTMLTDALHGAFGKPLIGFFVLGAISSAQAFAPAYACFEVAAFFLPYLFACLIAQEIARGSGERMLWVMQAMAAVCAVYSLKFLGYYIGSLSLGHPLDLYDFASGFSNYRFFNHVQTVTLPLLIMLCTLTPAHHRMRWAWLALSAYWWMALFATGGRGTLVGMAAACSAVALLRRRQALPYLKLAAGSAVAGLAAYFILLILIPRLVGVPEIGTFSDLAHRTAQDPTSARLPLWRDAIGMMLAHPWLGVGPMHYAHRVHDPFSAAHPHDWVMQIGSEWGIPALLCLCAAVARGGKALLDAGRRIAPNDRFNHAIHAGLLVTGIAILVDGLVSGLLVMPQSRLAIVLYLGCAIGWYKTMCPSPIAKPAPSAWRRRAASVLAGAAMLVLAIAVYPDILPRMAGEPLAPSKLALNPVMHWPRLWEAGFF